MRGKQILAALTVIVAAGFLLIQLVPYGRAHDNPAVVTEPTWDSPQTRELAARACFDCHSNETIWPWYAGVAPVSWLVQRDVDRGREHLNFSDWNQSHDEHGHEGHEPEEIGEPLLEGEMPPAQYLLNHPEARLTEAERAALAEGLRLTAELSPIAGDDHEVELQDDHSEDEAIEDDHTEDDHPEDDHD